MFESLHERGMASRMLARLEPGERSAQAVGGEAFALGPAGCAAGHGTRRLAEARLARREMLVVDPSYRAPEALLEALEAMQTLRAPRAGGMVALAAALGGGRLDALHLLCAAVPHALIVGGEVVDPLADNDRAAEAVRALGSLFARNADGGPAPSLMLYGTSFGTGAEGARAIEALAQRIGVAVAATGERMEHAADRATWHAKARPPARATRKASASVASTASAVERPRNADRLEPDDADGAKADDPGPLDEALGELRRRLTAHRTKPSPAPTRPPRRIETVPGDGRQDPSPGRPSAAAEAASFEDRMSRTFVELQRRVAEHRAARERMTAKDRDANPLAVPAAAKANAGEQTNPPVAAASDVPSPKEVPSVEDRVERTFAALRQRVLDHRSASGGDAERENGRQAPSRVPPASKPAKPARQHQAKPARQRIVRHRADGTPLTPDPEKAREPIPVAPIEPTFEDAISMAPLADPMSALHAIMAKPERYAATDSSGETAPEAAGSRDAPSAPEPTEAPKPKAIDAAGVTGTRSLPSPVENDAEADRGGDVAAVVAASPIAPSDDALRAFAVEALLRPEAFAEDADIALGEGVALSVEGPRVRFAASWGAKVAAAQADLTVLGIEDPSSAPVHLIGTLGEGWLSLYVEGALAASVPLGSGAKRTWTLSDRAPETDAFDGEVALLRLVPRHLDGNAALALHARTRGGDVPGDHRWATGPLAPAKDAEEVATPTHADASTGNAEDSSEAIVPAATMPAIAPTVIASSPAPTADEPISAPPEPDPAPAVEPDATPLSVAGAERRVVPGEALAIDLPALAGCALADVVRGWPVTMPPWLKLDPLEGIAHGRVPRDHPGGTIALVVTSANDRGATATLAVTLRVG